MQELDNTFWTTPAHQDLQEPPQSCAYRPNGQVSILQVMASVCLEHLQISVQDIQAINNFKGHCTVCCPCPDLYLQTMATKFHLSKHLSWPTVISIRGQMSSERQVPLPPSGVTTSKMLPLNWDQSLQPNQMTEISQNSGQTKKLHSKALVSAERWGSLQEMAPVYMKAFPTFPAIGRNI